MTDVAIVGGGLAGIVCAAELERAGVECTLLEASDGLGGRVRTDSVDGFLLDRGFQILLTAYPQVRARLDLDALGLGRFAPGALVRSDGATHPFSDPLRRPGDGLRTARAPFASAADKLRTVGLVAGVCATPARRLLRRADRSTAARLAGAGFSPSYVDAFWRPLFAGIQLDPELDVSARRFDVILRMLALGSTGLPQRGIGAVTAQLATRLRDTHVRLLSPVESVQPGAVVLRDGERVAARAVVVATEGPEAHRLLGDAVPDPGSRAAACCWFTAPAPPVRGPHLMLDGAGPAMNVVVISEVQPAYAPPGRTLIAAAVPGPAALADGLAERVRAQLSGWLRLSELELDLLRADVIPHGQPDQRPPLRPRRRVDLGEMLFVCGDHRDTASIQGAMFSGERAAAAVLRRLRGVSAR